MSDENELNSLREQLDAALKRNAELEQKLQQQETAAAQSASVRGSAESVDVAPINEADVTLRRLVQRIAMILQAEKIVIMFHDRESGELMGIPPSYGVEEEKLKLFRIRASHGISGHVFREATPLIFHDIMNDPRAQEDPFALLHVSNGLTVPLVIEKRDEENRVIERTTIGVLHAFNKRHGEDFNDEDVRLLERMARNVGSIIANLQLYQEAIQKRQELVQTFEALTAGLMLVSSEGRISQINSSARAIFDLGPETVGKDLQATIPVPELFNIVQNARENTEGGKGEIQVHVAGSERIYEAQAASVHGEDGKDLGVVVILNDVTDMRNIDKMKSSFVAMASHELRTPLTAIKGFSSTLLEGLDADLYTKEDQREFLGIVVSECDRLRRLIDDLLNTSRIESGESLQPNYSRFPLLPLLEKSVAVQQQASSKHRVLLQVHNALPETIVGDEDKLDQILTNLLNNAIKYSPNGGDVTVHAKNEGESTLIGVEDQGMGIPKEHLQRVFEKFHRVNNDDNRKIYGTGLGLFLVHHLVTQVHMGEIWAESEVGKGSTFWVRIPNELDIEKAKQANE
ncbi:ATP-binding protein [Fimbriimonas ginsengisoli]|uniref:histidine kinase n=1 Tax=Fimbriimonas ginsengisoli Gsoil 348 TaxID=661478 RepID=A0A068NP32_FIMGI|nr:ATP-binding protein [Fimbriimonas ginsengisoli]AIE84505.1 two-component sensor kinase, probably involved in phosphate sensing [Fimbriimonas ginsengisoli Gsoil 348]